VSSRLRRAGSIALAALVLAAAWQVAALVAESNGPSTAALAPTWQHIVLVDFPGFASFDGGLASSDYGVALGVLGSNALATTVRVLVSLALAFIIGTGVGLLAMSTRISRGIVSPIARVLRNIPLLALVPLFLIWFGGQESGVIAFITFGLSIIYLTSTIAAIDTVDPTRLAFARTLGASRLEALRDVTLPSIVPNLVDATRVAVGVAFAVGLGGEFLAAQEGLGRLLLVSQTYVLTGRMIVILLCYILLAGIATGFVDLIGARLTRWMPRSLRTHHA